MFVRKGRDQLGDPNLPVALIEIDRWPDFYASLELIFPDMSPYCSLFPGKVGKEICEFYLREFRIGINKTSMLFFSILENRNYQKWQTWTSLIYSWVLRKESVISRTIKHQKLGQLWFKDQSVHWCSHSSAVEGWALLLLCPLDRIVFSYFRPEVVVILSFSSENITPAVRSPSSPFRYFIDSALLDDS